MGAQKNLSMRQVNPNERVLLGTHKIHFVRVIRQKLKLHAQNVSLNWTGAVVRTILCGCKCMCVLPIEAYIQIYMLCS